jgi:hypothetical protein
MGLTDVDRGDAYCPDADFNYKSRQDGYQDFSRRDAHARCQRQRAWASKATKHVAGDPTSSVVKFLVSTRTKNTNRVRKASGRNIERRWKSDGQRRDANRHHAEKWNYI